MTDKGSYRTPLLSKFCKNKNNTDFSLDQKYLLKLHENILKYYWLNLFKETAIGLQMTSESL